ncbi:MAG: host-nuclease inhibitor Gam family protein [Nitrospiraceae bacterium]|nr:host-nuclease inhibitor Gam family protein [Nitrospiraceae bacterium]
MARLKPKNTITTRPQAEAAMSKLNEIDRQLAAWDLDEADAIASVRQHHADLQRKGGRPGLEAEKALLIKEIEAWADGDKERWERKTQETPFGSFGFRVSQPAVALVKKIASKFDAALILLQEKLPQYVRDVPQIDKERILADERSEALDSVALAKCGLKVIQDDEFWVETNASKDLEAAAKKLRAA